MTAGTSGRRTALPTAAALGLVLMLGWAAARAADPETDWSFPEPEQPVALGLWGGADTDGGWRGGLHASLPLVAGLRAEGLAQRFEAGESSGDRLRSDYWRLGLTTDPWANWAVRADYEASGDHDLAQTRDAVLELSHRRGAFSLWLRGGAGRVELALRGRLVERRPGLPAAVESDRWRAGAGMGYDTGRWRGWLDYQEYTYEENLGRLGNSLRAQVLLEPGALDLAFALADWSLRTGAGRRWERFSLDLELAALRAAADRELSTFLGATARHRLHQSLELGVRADLELGGGPVLTELLLDLTL